MWYYAIDKIILPLFHSFLLDSDNRLNSCGWFVVLSIYGVSFVTVLLTGIKISRDEKRKNDYQTEIEIYKADRDLLQSVIEIDNEIERQKVLTMRCNASTIYKGDQTH